MVLISHCQVTQARITQAGWVIFGPDLPTLSLASQNTAIANAGVWPGKGAHAEKQEVRDGWSVQG